MTQGADECACSAAVQCVYVCVCVCTTPANLRKGSSEVQQEVWDVSSSQGVLLNGTSQQGKQGDCCRPVALPLVPTAVLSRGDTFGFVLLLLNVVFFVFSNKTSSKDNTGRWEQHLICVQNHVGTKSGRRKEN